MKTFKTYLKEDLADVQKANRDKENALRQANRAKEATVRRAEQEKEQMKRQAERDKEREKQSNQPEGIVKKVTEYIKSDGKRKRCAGGDGRRSENEASGDKAAYQKFFNAKLKKYGVKSPDELKGADEKKFYDEIDAEWQGDNEND